MLILLILLVSDIGILGTTPKVEASSGKFVHINKTTNIYDNINGKPVMVGTLLKGHEYPLVSEDNEYYYISFGNGTAYFHKSVAQLITQPRNPKMYGNYRNSYLVVITKHTTYIYDRLPPHGKPFAAININIRYPVIEKVGKYYKIKVGNRLGYIHEANVKIDRGIPVLMYHHMLENPQRTVFKNNSMVIKVSEFEKQLKYLSDHGYRTIQLQELENYLKYRHNLTGNVVAITFDDGLDSTVKYAYPILKKYHFKATQFLIMGKVLGFALPFDENVLHYIGYKEMKETADIYDFQSHTVGLHLREHTHNTPYMILKNFDEIKEDLLNSKKMIGAYYMTPAHVRYLAYPYGQYDAEAMKAAMYAGFELAFTTETGNVKLGDHKFTLKRQGIGPYHDIHDFIEKLNGTY